jgi:hypothetical protein
MRLGSYPPENGGRLRELPLRYQDVRQPELRFALRQWPRAGLADSSPGQIIGPLNLSKR